MIFNINSTRGQTRFLTWVARVTCLVFRNILNAIEHLYLARYPDLVSNARINRLVLFPMQHQRFTCRGISGLPQTISFVHLTKYALMSLSPSFVFQAAGQWHPGPLDWSLLQLASVFHMLNLQRHNTNFNLLS